MNWCGRAADGDSVVYDSDDLEIDPTAGGAVTATLDLGNDDVRSVCFHTVDAACADF